MVSDAAALMPLSAHACRVLNVDPMVVKWMLAPAFVAMSLIGSQAADWAAVMPLTVMEPE